MPRPSRDERRAELARIAQRWSRWLKQAIAEREIDIKTLVDLAGQAGATFDKSNVSKWLAGDSTADPTNAAIIGRVLERDPLEALREAGHHILAGQLAAEPTVDDVLRAARDEGASAPVLLREAGHDDLADYIEDVAGSTGTSASALEPPIARVRQITDGLTDGQRAILAGELLDQIGDLYLLAEKKAEMLREGDAGRGAS